ncbi:MAG: type II toxin-antitoxin system VapC family toxin [Verrucomicrobia bacterium]|nr:type II toxin-antitoxin system VapC family toxin [Verrucomicrobiota bacterium]
MRWLIDTDVLIEGERGAAAFVAWLGAQTEVATADIVRCEFLLGLHAVPDSAKRRRGEQFYRDRIAGLASLPTEPEDYEKAAQVAGEARRLGKGKPSVVDGLLAAIALRTGATVATRNESDFKAMGCPCANPLASPKPSD